MGHIAIWVSYTARYCGMVQSYFDSPTVKAPKALDKRGYLVMIMDNFCYFSINTYVVTPNLNCLDETVQMRGHNIWFR